MYVGRSALAVRMVSRALHAFRSRAAKHAAGRTCSSYIATLDRMNFSCILHDACIIQCDCNYYIDWIVDRSIMDLITAKCTLK